jgi:hypothetical protein
MAQVTVAWLMSEDHRANRKNGRSTQMTVSVFFSEMLGVGFIAK